MEEVEDSVVVDSVVWRIKADAYYIIQEQTAHESNLLKKRKHEEE